MPVGVVFSRDRLAGSFREVRDGVYVSVNVLSSFDWPMERGFYAVDWGGPIVGESLDGAFYYASQGISGDFSFDINPDWSVSPIAEAEMKYAAASSPAAILSVDGWMFK